MNKNFPRGIEVTSGAILRKNDKIFLAKEPKFSDKWVCPGGHVNEGETIIEACLREVKEETGLIAEPVEIIHFGELINSKDFHRPAHFIYFDVLCEVDDKNEQIRLNSELTEYGWFTLDEAFKLNLADSYRETLLKYKKYLEK